MQFTVIGSVMDGPKGLILDVPDEAKRELSRWVKTCKPGHVTITVREGKESKTVQQLRKVHAMFRDIAHETGQDADDIKLWLKAKYLTRPKEVVNLETGDVTTLTDYIPSLADLERDEMRDFIESISAWAGQFLGMTFDRSAA